MSIDSAFVDTLLSYVHQALNYPIRASVPLIEIDETLDTAGKIHWGWISATIVLKRWREGNVVDESVLCHELCHLTQFANDCDLSDTYYEAEAILVQIQFLRANAHDPRICLSFASIQKMMEAA